MVAHQRNGDPHMMMQRQGKQLTDLTALRW
jgi:hypothetical protein